MRPLAAATGGTPTQGVRSAAGRRPHWVLAILLAALLGACAPSSGDPPAAAEVAIDRFEYVPDRLEVPVGTAVTWTNEDRFGHTVTSGEPHAPDGRFDGQLGTTTDGEGKTFTHTFTETGSYTYHCSLHPRMVGEVVVVGDG